MTKNEINKAVAAATKALMKAMPRHASHEDIATAHGRLLQHITATMVIMGCRADAIVSIVAETVEEFQSEVRKKQ